MRTDKWYYKLMQTLKDLPFQLLHQPVPEVEYEFKSVEVKEFGFRLDGLIVPHDETSPLILVEAQMQPDPNLYYGICAEFSVYLQQYRPRNPWYVLVIYPDRETEKEVPHLDRILVFANLHRVYLDELADDSSFGLRLLKLVVAQPEEMAKKSRALVAELEGLDPFLRERCLELITEIINRKFPDLTEEEILSMLQLVELEQTRAYQQGREKGREEGREEGESELVIRLLTRRFGSLTADTQAQIKALALDQVEALAEALLDFSNIIDLETWLKSIQRKRS